MMERHTGTGTQALAQHRLIPGKVLAVKLAMQLPGQLLVIEDDVSTLPLHFVHAHSERSTLLSDLPQH